MIGVADSQPAPVARTDSGSMPFTVAAVAVAIKAGVSNVPCAVVTRPRRATPSVAERVKENWVIMLFSQYQMGLQPLNDFLPDFWLIHWQG